MSREPSVFDPKWRPRDADGWRRRFGGYATLPEPGQVIAYAGDRKAWRVIAVHERHQAQWCEETVAAWEKAGRPDPETWPGRERSIWAEPPRNPAPNKKDRRGLRVYPWAANDFWWPLTDPWPQCVDCERLWPCPCDDRNRAAEKAMAELDRLGAVLPGCCWACGEPISRLHKSIEFDGENLLLPGAGPAMFHTAESRKGGERGTCRAQAVKYEEAWIAAAPGRPRRLRCPGTLYRHHAYSECSEPDGCPGVDASHGNYVYCSTASYTWETGGAGPTELKPVTYCGERGCRGPKPPTPQQAADETTAAS